MEIVPTVNIAEEFYVNITYNTAAKCLGDIIEEYYEKQMRLDYFLIIHEAHMLLNHIGLIEITKEFDRVVLLSATADDNKHFACFRDYIIIIISISTSCYLTPNNKVLRSLV